MADDKKRDSRFSRRQFLWASGTTTALTGLAGCAGQSETDETTESTTTTREDSNNSGNQQGGGDKKLDQAWSLPLNTPHPLGWLGLSDLSLVEKIWERPLTINEDSEVQPNVVKNWETSNNGETYTWTLREGVTFHDGEQVTADDLAFSLRLLDEHSWPLANEPYTGLIQPDKMEVKDDTTLVTPLSRAAFDLPIGMADNARILPKHIWEKVEDPSSVKGTNMEKNLHIGSGPFVLEEHKSEQFTRFSVHEDYWGKKPNYDEHVIQVISEADTQILRIKKGNLDLLDVEASGQFVNTFKTTDNLALIESNPTSVHHFMFGTDRFPFDNREFRRAISHVIPTQKLVDTIYAGVENKATSFLHNAIPEWHNDDVPTYDYDPEKAKSILKDAGYTQQNDGWLSPDGEKVEVEYLIYNLLVWPRISGLVKSEFEKIGIPTTIESVDIGTWVDRVWGNHNYQMTSQIYWEFLEPGSTLASNHYYEGGGPEKYDGFTQLNSVHFKSEEFNNQLDKYRTSSDRKARQQAIYRCQEILAEEITMLPIAYTGSGHFFGLNTAKWDQSSAQPLPKFGMHGTSALTNLASK